MDTPVTKNQLLPVIKNNNLMELLPKALNVERENFMITPSEFIKELSLTTEERQKKSVRLADCIKLTESSYPTQIRVLPNIIMFQRIKDRVTYKLTLQIKNIGKTLVPLKMHCPTSIFFCASYLGIPTNKIAPGLSVDYEITFTPKEAKDYSHHIIFKGKDDIFEVPIVAIGPRAMLDIPDQIFLNPAPVKIPVSKMIVVRNIGDAPALYTFITPAHFTVTPSKGILKTNDSTLLTVTFVSDKVEEVTETLYLVLETGEKLTITLHGSSENVNVRLDKNSINHDDTFLGLKRCKVVRINNSSSQVLKFSWKMYKSVEEDKKTKERLKEKYKEMAELEIAKDVKVVHSGLSNSHIHKLSCERILKDELELLENFEFAFQDSAFSIVPLEGEIWPNGNLEVTVGFEPKECGTVTSEAFLEISGRDTRLPLKIKGTGIGPNIVLNVKTLDLDYVYLCSTHKYEIIALNNGDISGSMEYLPRSTVFGGKIEVAPATRYLKPGQTGAFVITFTSNRQGDFTEEIRFSIMESKQTVTLLVKGKVISPTLHFDIRQIDFGNVPVGFPTVREVTLNNLSVVPVTFSLKVNIDGNIPSLSYEEFAALSVKQALPESPKEFKIDPVESVVEPFSSKNVTLTLTANKSGHFLSYLVVDMWDSESGSVSCPIRFHPHIATVMADPEVITIPFCFINFPYTRTINLRNLSKVPGFFYIAPPDPRVTSNVTFSASIPQSVIEPRSSVPIDITIITSVLGRQTIPINVIIFGYDEPREFCSISLVGQGPVVTMNPNSLHWGDLTLLKPSKKILVLSNESPIPATLTIGLAKANSPWSATPTQCTLNPEESLSVVVTLFLNDRGKFDDTLKVNVHNGKGLNIPLSATGVGSSLKITPSISPKYDLGVLFSHKKYEFEIKVENRGTKYFGILWCPMADYKTYMYGKMVNPPDLVFRIEPPKLELLPNETKSICLEILGPAIGVFKQTFYCYANIGGPAKELHMTAEIIAEFVEPLLKFNKFEMRYWYNIGSDGVEQNLEDEVTLTNLSILPICVNVIVNHPFVLVLKNGERTYGFEASLDGNESIDLTVAFIAETKGDTYSRFYRENLTITFKERSKKYFVVLIGEINYPNVVVLPKHVDFGFVPVGLNAYKEISLVNISPINVYYEITWDGNISKLVKIKSEEASPLRYIPGSSSEDLILSGSDNNIKEEKNNPVMEQTSSSIYEPIKPVARMPHIKITKKEIQSALFPLTRNYFKCEDELMNAYRMARDSNQKNADETIDYVKVCDITPFRGKLEKYSSQVLAVRFSSDVPSTLRAEAFINIKSGPTEIISIDAKCREINFYLDKTELDFGKLLFCETKSQVLKIHNSGLMPFSYQAFTVGSNGCEFNNVNTIKRETLTVSPRNGTVPIHSDVELVIKYHPGMPGAFSDKFLVQIEFLETKVIKIKGVGVFPQVHISLPRSDLLNINPVTGYRGIACLTPEWFISGIQQTCKSPDLYQVKPYRSEESNLEILKDTFETDPLLADWDTLDRPDVIPSEIDIQLAIERSLALELLERDPLRDTTFSVYARTIPHFVVPAYDLDFGVAVIGRQQEQTIMITNYGPLSVILYTIIDMNLKEDGFQVRLKNRNELKVKSSIQFNVVFNPTKIKYNKRFETVHNQFHFEVYHGPKIPIKVRATVTYPYILPSVYTMNYGEVKCGCCKVMSVKLHNPGLITALWSLIFTVKPTGIRNISNVSYLDGKAMFHLNQKSGALNPGENCNVQITFKPDFGANFTAALWIQVNDSLDELKILLIGEGIEPKLKISENTLTFGPTLPYPNKLDRFFIIENPCPFPVEFFFPSFDNQIFEEDRILRAVCAYYKTDEILLPVRNAGELLPSELIKFHTMLLDNLNAKFMENQREKEIEREKEKEREMEREKERELETENTEENALDHNDDNFISQVSVPDRKKKSKTFSRSRTTTLNSRMMTYSEVNKESIFEKKTSSEIEEMLLEQLQEIREQEHPLDPVGSALRSFIPPVTEPEYREGLAIIFHGAPYSRCTQLANKAGLITNLRVYNIDKIVLEEAAYGRTEAGAVVRELIEQAFYDHIDPVAYGFQGIVDDFGDDYLMKTSNFGATLNILEEKFEALVNLRDTLLSGKVPKHKPATSKSNMSRMSTPILKPMNPNVPIANVTEDLVLSILKYRFSKEVVNGFILEGLKSVFFNTNIKAFVTVLKELGNINKILVIFLMNNFEQYHTTLLNHQAEQEEIKADLHMKYLSILEEDEDIFKALKLPPEEAEEILSEYLSVRREEYEEFLKKKEALYESMKEKLTEISEKNLVNQTKSSKISYSQDKKKEDKGKKKETSKGVKISEKAPKITSESGKKSGKPKRDSIELEFEAFEVEYQEMLAMIEGWDQRLGLSVPGVSDFKVKRDKSPRKIEPIPINKPRAPPIGVHLWWVDVSRPEKNLFASVCEYLKTTLFNEFHNPETENWPLDVPESMTFSVVSSPNLRHREPALPIYVLSPVEPISEEPGENANGERLDPAPSASVAAVNVSKLSRSQSQVSLKFKKRSSVNVKRRKGDSKISEELKSNKSKKFNSIIFEDNQLKSRWILQPKESMTWRVRYCPTTKGSTEQAFQINLMNWQSYYVIQCKGVCDIPSLNMNPESLFPQITLEKTAVSLYYPTYSLTEKLFDFGCIITSQIGAETRKPKHIKTTLLNNSELPAEVTIMFYQDAISEHEQVGSPHFKIKPNTLHIPPNKAAHVIIDALPMRNGVILDTILFFVKNNPRIETLTVKCEGEKAHVVVNPKSVNFERLLLHRSEIRRLVFSNTNNVSLFLRLADLQNIPEQFSFSQHSGWISPLEALIIDVSYNATTIQVINEFPVSWKVYDVEDAVEPVQESTFTLSAEAYDVALDISFSKLADHLDFGDVPVDSSHKTIFYLKNVGKYPMSFKTEKDAKVIQDSEQSMITLTPDEGKLLPQKIFNISVTFLANNEIWWKRLPALKILLLDPHHADQIIARIPIDISARSYFATFEIRPSKELNFGPIRVGKVLTRSFVIENTGKFPFRYVIIPKPNENAGNEGESARKKSSKRSGSKKTGSKRTSSSKSKKFGGTINVGVFDVSPSSGTIGSGKYSEIKVNFTSNEVKKFEEIILIIVKESKPLNRSGIELHLSGEGCLPKIDFDDYKTIFREHFVTNTEEEFTCPLKYEPYTLYVKNDMKFIFKNAIVGKPVLARIHFPNACLIPCSIQVTAHLNGTSLTELNSIFEVSPERLVIEPYTSGTATIVFTPDAIQDYYGELTIVVQMTDDDRNIYKTIQLQGNGILPQIEIIEPSYRLIDTQIPLSFPATPPGHSSSASISFANVGLIKCKVILEFYKYQENIFTLVPKGDTANMLKVWELEEPINHTAILSFSPGEVAEFKVIFKPVEVQTYTSQIKLYIVNNPFENLLFNLLGDVYLEEVMIENIQMKLPFVTGTGRKYEPPANSVPGQYHLNFGDCYVNKTALALMQLVNKTDKDYFKFEWEEINGISVVPTKGHLYPDSYKEIMFALFSNEPTELEEIPVQCVLEKIIVDTPTDPSWDSRLVQYREEPNSEVALVFSKYRKESNLLFADEQLSGQEPKVEVIPDTDKTLIVNITANVDYTRLFCPITKITFNNTFMFQSRVYPLVLENIGNVELEYNLTFQSVTYGPISHDKETQVKEQSLNMSFNNRPRTSSPAVKRLTVQRPTNFKKCGKARPLTSESFLNLKPKVIEESASSSWSFEEPKVPQYNPFALENSSGKISPQGKAVCKILFSPMDINVYTAVLGIDVPYHQPDLNTPEIRVLASSVMPYCHFNIPESDYLESGRRDYSRPGPVGYAAGIPLNPETKTIEIKVIGVGRTLPIKFHVINPTDEDYTFSWTNTTQIRPDVIEYFHCSTTDGRIQAGRQTLMIFSFLARTCGTFESFWEFSIPHFKVQTPFLLVAEVRDPSVSCLSNHVRMKPSFIGSSSVDSLTLVNQENEEFEYSFYPESLYSEGRVNALELHPISGTVPPKSETHISVTFTSKIGGKFLFYVKCKIKGIVEPLQIFIETEAYVIQPILVYEDVTNKKHNVVSDTENILNFGNEMSPNCPETLKFLFTSTSRASFYYEWVYDQKAIEDKHGKLTISVKEGHVTSYSRGSCNLTLEFLKKSALVNFPVKVKISKGPTFHFLLNGAVSTPCCEFSFTSYDFGYCFPQNKNVCFYEVTLFVKNKRNTDVILECKMLKNVGFTYSLPVSVLTPNSEVSIPICFHPTEHREYTDELQFLLNGLNPKTITLKGRGCECKLMLYKAEDKIISMGVVRVGKSSERKFLVINKSLATASVLVGFSDQLPVDTLTCAKPKKYPVDLSKNHRLSGILTVHPSTFFTIKPQETYTMTITYSPKSNSSNFQETLSIQCQEHLEPLCVITGSGIGPQIDLDRYFLNFGAIITTCTATLRLMLINSGNMGASFEWSVNNLPKEYKIYPSNGYISPESKIFIEVQFSPVKADKVVDATVECKLYLPQNEQYPSLFLKITGDCVTLPEAKQTVYLNCHVREMDMKPLSIENWSGNEWQLMPSVSGQYFTGYDVIVVPSLTSIQYEITYHPFTMTPDGKYHEGSVFLRYPNGQGELYQLKGSSFPPRAEDIIRREIPCKTKFVELLKVRNWLQQSQRFKSKITLLSIPPKEDPIWTYEGLEYIEAPGMAEKEYSLTFFSYKPALLEFKVEFINEETREYQWYDITYDVIIGGPLEVITLKTGVRQTCSYEVKLENPLNKPISYKLESTSTEIHFSKNTVDVPAEQTIYTEIRYIPIHPGECTEELIAKCRELGSFVRELRLIASEVQPEPVRTFKTPLGGFQVQDVWVKNLASEQATFKCIVDSEDFAVKQSVGFTDDNNLKFTITHEPSEVGNVSATLTIISEEAGKFVFPLVGIGLKPTAQGPYIILPGNSINITFKNVFKINKEFSMYTDNPAFTLKTSQETLKPKEEIKINVHMESLPNLQEFPEYKEKGINVHFPITGQLIIECFAPYVKWQFYLKGVLKRT